MTKPVITFDESAKPDILDFFDKKIVPDGYIVEKENPSHKVLTPDGEELFHTDFAGVRKGSTIFISADLVSLVKLADLI